MTVAHMQLRARPRVGQTASKVGGSRANVGRAAPKCGRLRLKYGCIFQLDPVPKFHQSRPNRPNSGCSKPETNTNLVETPLKSKYPPKTPSLHRNARVALMLARESRATLPPDIGPIQSKPRPITVAQS